MEPSLINIIFSSVSSVGIFFSVFSVGNPDPDILKTLYTKIYGTLLIPLLRRFDGTAKNGTNNTNYMNYGLCIRAYSCHSWLFKLLEKSDFSENFMQKTYGILLIFQISYKYP